VDRDNLRPAVGASDSDDELIEVHPEFASLCSRIDTTRRSPGFHATVPRRRDSSRLRCCPEYAVHFKIKVHQSGMPVADHQLNHSHLIDHRSDGAYHRFRPEVIQEIIRLTGQHATLGHIPTVLDLNATANPVYGVLRLPLESSGCIRLRSAKVATT
jgi:hypothetical protein